MQEVDVLVYGAGPSGTVAASMANKNGLKVKIIEKTKFPRFVIGESLLPKCMEHLEEAGFLDALSKQNYQKKHGAKFIRGDKSCLFDFGEQYTEGWKWTWQVPRDHFDNVLAEEVQKMGVEIDFETAVTGVNFYDNHSVTTVSKVDGSTEDIKAKYVIDASGYGRVLPRLLGLEKKSSMPPRKAAFAHFTDSMRPDGSAGKQITFVIHEVDVWVWIIPFSNGTTSIGFVGNPEFFDRYSGDKNCQLRAMVKDVPQIRDRFENQRIQLDAKIIEAYAVSASQFYGNGFVITGNSSEFIDPVFSSGVTFATESGLRAGKLVSAELKGEEVNWQTEYVDHIMQGVETFRTYVKHWYDGSLQQIFFYTSDTSRNPANFKMKRQICSVLAGYVWDLSNPFVKKHQKAIASLSKVIKLY